MDRKTKIEVAAVLLISFVVVALGYFVAESVLMRPIYRKWREVIILGIRFTNISSNLATNGTYDVYPHGERALWDCGKVGQEKCYFTIKVWSNGWGGHVYSNILADSTEYDHWEGDLDDGQSTTWRTIDFSPDSYSHSRFSNFTVRAYDASISPWQMTDERTVTVECVSSMD